MVWTRTSTYCQTFNPLATNVPYHIGTSQLICIANQLTGFYVIMMMMMMMMMMMWCGIFVVWLTDERGLALFPAGTIVTGPHYRKSPRRSMQDLKLNQLRHSGSPVNLLHIFRRTFSKNTSGQLLL